MERIENHLLQFTSGGREFRFAIKCKRDQQLGPVTLDHWWMPVTPLYGQRAPEGPAGNHREIVSCYWAAVRARNDDSSVHAQETLLLAGLVPHVRSLGSRKIFNDAFLGGTTSRAAHSSAMDLERLLKQAAGQRCSRADFHARSWKLLGRSEFPSRTAEEYQRVLAELLDGPKSLLVQGRVEEALAAAAANWDPLVKRRHFREQRRAVLDALSYESRTAFHAAYSVVWIGLLYVIDQMGDLTPEEATFHQLWHTDRRDAVYGTSQFHGHVFGLHPALGPLILTETGRNLIGNWVAHPTEEEKFQELLHGCLLSLHHYDEGHDEQRQRRKTDALDNERSKAARAKLESRERNKGRGKRS